jgi:hypothetical protein
MNVSTQLRLITKAPAATPAASAPAARPLRGRVATSRRPATRRPVHWEGRWRLDEHTREIGRAGVASARAALAAVHRDEATDLRQAS